jgi:hypothetical protein
MPQNKPRKRQDSNARRQRPLPNKRLPKLLSGDKQKSKQQTKRDSAD